MHSCAHDKKTMRGLWAALFAFVVALSVFPMAGLAVEGAVQGENGAPTREAATEISVTVSVTAEEGVEWIAPAPVSIEDGKSGWDATAAALDAAGLTYEAPVSEYGVFLNSITKDSVTLGSRYDAETGDGAGWTFYVNGAMAEVGAGDYVAQEGDELAWAYETYNIPPFVPELEPEPEPTTIVPVDPSAEHPALTSQWPNFARGADGASVEAPTATSDAEVVWTYRTLPGGAPEGGFGFVSLSDPIIVGDTVFLLTASGESDASFTSTFPDHKLVVLDRTTGEVLKTMAGKDSASAAGADASAHTLAAPIDSTSRPAYADGIVVVQLQGGRLQGIAADSLTTLWVTDPLTTANDQPETLLSTLAIHDGSVYATSTSGWGKAPGKVYSFDLLTGEKDWEYDSPNGYYWAGPAVLSNHVVVAGDDAEVVSLDPATGAVVDTAPLEAGSRSGITPTGTDTFVTTSTDGTLYSFRIGADGSITRTGSVKVTSGPGFETTTNRVTVVDGVAYVGGMGSGSDDAPGLLAIVDLGTMEVTARIALPANVQSSPLVSKTAGGTFVYVIVNTGDESGGLYVHEVGTDTATQLYLPSGELMDFSLSSPIAATDGMIYFTNDSGTLFALKAAPVPDAPVTPDADEPTMPEAPAVDVPAADRPTAPAADVTEIPATTDAPAKTSGTTPKTGDEFPWAMVIAAGLGVLVVAAGVVLVMKNRKK